MSLVVARRLLHVPTPPKGNHVFVVLTDPKPPIDQVLMVPLCTVRNGHDATCILEPGNHEFVKEKTFIAYGRARLERADKLERGLKSGLVTDKGLLEQSIFDRVIEGVHASRQTKPFMLEFLES